jgi:hypothetical protein
MDTEGVAVLRKYNRMNSRAYGRTTEFIVDTTKCQIWDEFYVHETRRCKKNDIEKILSTPQSSHLICFNLWGLQGRDCCSGMN